MAIVWSILVSLGCVLLCGGLCYGVLQIRFFQNTPLSSQALSLATLVGFWGGHAFMSQRLWPGFPPVDVSLWWIYGLPMLALLAYRPHVFLTTLSSGVYAYLLTEPMRQYEWSWIQAIAFTLAAALIMGRIPHLVNSMLSDVTSSEHKKCRWLWPWVMAITSLGSAGVFLLGSSASLSQQALFLLVLQALTLIFLRFHSRNEVSAGLVVVNLWLLLMLWLNMLLFTSLSYVALVGLLALFTPYMLSLQPMSKASFGVQLLTVGLGSVLCMAIAAACVFGFQPQAGLYYGRDTSIFSI